MKLAKEKILALALCAFLALFALSALSALVLHTHDCDGQAECVVCGCLDTARTALRQLGAAQPLAGIAALAAIGWAALAAPPTLAGFGRANPVALGVQLNH